LPRKNALAMIIGGCKQLQEDGPGPARVLVMSGVPLSGKSHLINLIEKRVNGDFLLVRSDEVRPVVAKSLGRKRPAYDDIEHVTTFIVASEVIRTGLTLNWPVIVDATNLKEEFRKWAYDPADAMMASIIVVFMQVTDELANLRLAERRRFGSAATFSVYQKLKYEMESVSKCSKPYVVINSDGDLRPYAKNLANWLTGKTETVPGLKRPSAKSVYSSEPAAAGPEPGVYVSSPPDKVQNEEVQKETEPELPSEPEPAKAPKVKKKPRPRGAKRIVYDFYTGEEIEVDD